MTFDEFYKLKQIYVDGWTLIAEDGGGINIKCNTFIGYENCCVACSIALKAAEVSFAEKRTVSGTYCKFCPIDKFREKATTFAPCEKNGSVYQRWLQALDNERPKLAMKVAGLQWTYLDIYEKITSV